MTNSLPRPEVIITHESDLDGLLAGILLQRLARKLFDTEVRLEAYNYNYWRQRDPREKSGWVADLSFESRLDKPIGSSSITCHGGCAKKRHSDS